MSQYLYAKNTTNVILILKLLNNRHRGSSSRKAEIGCISKVYAQGKSIDNRKHPLHYLLLIFPTIRNKDKQCHQRIGVHYCRSVEHPAPDNQFPQVIILEGIAEIIAVILKEIHDSCQHIEEIGEEEEK